MRNAKYVRTVHDQIIVFDESIQHSQFKGLNLVSAGFISIAENNGHIDCRCFGESMSLMLLSKGEEDAVLVRQQIISR